MTKVSMCLGTEEEVRWRDIKVGDLVKVLDDELFPADILCLKTGLRDKVCFIRTTNLDGESNLKIRKPIDLDAVLHGKDGAPALQNDESFADDDPIHEVHTVMFVCAEVLLFSLLNSRNTSDWCTRCQMEICTNFTDDWMFTRMPMSIPLSLSPFPFP